MSEIGPAQPQLVFSYFTTLCTRQNKCTVQQMLPIPVDSWQLLNVYTDKLIFNSIGVNLTGTECYTGHQLAQIRTYADEIMPPIASANFPIRSSTLHINMHTIVVQLTVTAELQRGKHQSETIQWTRSLTTWHIL